jgi:hypothetical protein
MRSVRTLYTALMVLLAKATDRELARLVSYLKEKNRILRARLPEQINTTPIFTAGTNAQYEATDLAPNSWHRTNSLAD